MQGLGALHLVGCVPLKGRQSRHGCAGGVPPLGALRFHTAESLPNRTQDLPSTPRVSTEPTRLRQILLAKSDRPTSCDLRRRGSPSWNMCSRRALGGQVRAGFVLSEVGLGPLTAQMCEQ